MQKFKYFSKRLLRSEQKLLKNLKDASFINLELLNS
jgi:hypothetical protein